MQAPLEYLSIEGWKNDWDETKARHPFVTSPLQSTRNFLEGQSQQPSALETARYEPGWTAISSFWGFLTLADAVTISYVAQINPSVLEVIPIHILTTALGIPFVAKQAYDTAIIAQRRTREITGMEKDLDYRLL